MPQKQGYDKPTLPGWHRCVSVCQVAYVAVLLRILGLLPQQTRLRAYPDGRSSKARTSGKSLKRRKRTGCLGTSGAAESPACSNWSLKGQEPLRCAASATSQKTSSVARQRCLPRVCQKPRTSFYDKDTIGLWMGIRTWPQTEVLGCTKAQYTRTSRECWALALTMTHIYSLHSSVGRALQR